ncbi:MAG: hypothetical protein GX799_04090 [Crenarchaeota archaeon]|jgi:hypothetical protein|nr:hypothetical protein [Thermoproteota archaeon]
MSENNRNLLTIGVVILTIVVAIVLYMAELIDWTLIVPVILLLSGFWLLTLGVIRMGKPLKYERSGFSTSALGITAVAVGGAWALFSFNWLYSLVVILLVVAGLAIAAALRRK